jgi:CRISPR-associated protein Csb2
MALLIGQIFPQGRFHATRWRENPFADSYGEWPPSPWRLLRALAARWFQYSRETGNRDVEAIAGLLRILAAGRPHYYLPSSASKGTTLKQYQPVSEHSWSDPNAGSGAVKRTKTTLFPDGYFVVHPEEPVIWQWPGIDLNERERELLSLLLSSITYFGRAESRSILSLVESSKSANCVPVSSGGNAPVLCFLEGTKLNFDSLLEDSDKGILEGSPVPPGTEWVYYRRPEPVPMVMRTVQRTFEPVPYVQFAVGGHVLPPIPLWIKVTERFRGRVLFPFKGTSQSPLLLSGKTAEGRPLCGPHEHAFYLLWPDEDPESPSRLIVWRKAEHFRQDEVDAMMHAATRPIPWTAERGGWTAQLVPLPGRTSLPKQFVARARVWESVTPFVRPHNRHFRRENGKSRPREEPETICGRLIEKVWGVRPERVEKMKSNAPWVKLHESAAMIRGRKSGGIRTPHVAPGHYLRVTFAEEFQGPLIVGDSAHFGVGVFRGI